jgi:hypothetical protein
VWLLLEPNSENWMAPHLTNARVRFVLQKDESWKHLAIRPSLLHGGRGMTCHFLKATYGWEIGLSWNAETLISRPSLFLGKVWSVVNLLPYLFSKALRARALDQRILDRLNEVEKDFRSLKANSPFSSAEYLDLSRRRRMLKRLDERVKRIWWHELASL